MRNTLTIAKYRTLAAFNAVRKSRGTIIATIFTFSFFTFMLLYMLFMILGAVKTGVISSDDLLLLLSIMFTFALILPLANGFRGRGISASPTDRDYLFTSPVKPREYFMATQISSVLSTLIFLLPVLLICVFFGLHSLGRPFSRSIVAVLDLIIFISLLNLIGGGITMLWSIFSKNTMRWLKNILYAIIAISVVSAIIFYFLQPSGLQALTWLYNLIPSTAAARILVMSATEAGLGVHNLLDIIVFGSWYLFFIGLTFRLSQTYYYDVLRSRAKRVVRRKKKPIIRWRLGPGKDIRHVLIQKNILSLWRTRRFFMPLLYSFIFLFLPLYQIIPTYTGSEPMGTFQSAIFIAILFMLMGVSGMVQGQIRKERGQMWIERSAGLKPEHVVDSIATAATMVGAIYVCVVSLILSFFFGAKVLIYLPLIIASGLIPANFAVYSGIASPPEGGMGFSSQMFLSLLSLLLSMPYFIPVLLSTFINDARSIFILSISILVYTVIVVLILRRKAGRKFATYEIPY